jgi:predicted ester cyclase
LRSVYELVNAGDIDGFGALIADDFVEHEEIPGLPPTKEGAVEDLIANGSKAVARVKVTATHQGEFMGVPPTGNAVAIQIIDIMSFDDSGLVCEHWGVADLLSLMQQVGRRARWVSRGLTPRLRGGGCR